MEDHEYSRVFLDHTIHIEIDRPLGSRHPQHGFVYPVNYSTVPGTFAPDSEPFDAYVLGGFEPLEEFTGCCIAVVHRLDDDNVKLIVVPEDKHDSDEQIQALAEFQGRFFAAIIQH